MKRKDLLEALEDVKPGLATTEVLEQSSQFAFMGDKIVTYNDEICVSRKLEELAGFTGAVNSDLLYKLLNKLTFEEVTLLPDGDKLIIKSGKSTTTFNIQKEIRLPLGEVEKPKEWHQLPKEFIPSLDMASKCCAKTNSTPVLTCVHIRADGYMEASDGYRLIKSHYGKALPIQACLLPGNTAARVSQYKATNIAKTKSWLHFRSGKTVLSCRVFEENFPKTEDKFNVKGHRLNFPPVLSNILDRAAVFTRNDQLSLQYVEVKVADKKITVQADHENAVFKEHAKYKGNEQVTFTVNPTFLQQMIKDGNYKCHMNKTTMKFQADNWEYVVCLITKNAE